MHKGIISLVLILWVSLVFGQETLQPRQRQISSPGVVYDKEYAITGYLHTKGFGLGAHFGDIKTYYKTAFYYVDFGTIKHPKEHRPSNQISRFSVRSRPYIYGKQNTFMVLRAGKGAKRYLSEKALRKGVAVGWVYELGPSIGLIKPYYLEVNVAEPGEAPRIETIKYSEDNEELFLNGARIDGYSGFFRGIDETQLTLGGHGRLGAHFAWGAFDKYVKALEVGIMIDAFVQSIDIMVTERNTPIFANLYLSLQFGKRR